MVNLGMLLTIIGDKVKNTTSAREGLNGSTPDESTYSQWSHVFSASSNALETSEELAFFTVILVLFFVFMFIIIYNVMMLIRVFMNIDGSLYQTKHIVKKLLTIGILLAFEFFFLNYIITVAQIMK
ncbi:MAG: hypothetical protein IJ809_07120 [Clostridia bacterium]|nr:hypothetical protein [Clostridia bacterium]